MTSIFGEGRGRAGGPGPARMGPGRARIKKTGPGRAGPDSKTAGPGRPGPLFDKHSIFLKFGHNFQGVISAKAAHFILKLSEADLGPVLGVGRVRRCWAEGC